MTRSLNKKPSHPPFTRKTHAERNDDLIAACKAHIGWMISKSDSSLLPRDTTPDEYIKMCMAMTRGQRRALDADARGVVDFARAVHAAQTGEVEE